MRSKAFANLFSFACYLIDINCIIYILYSITYFITSQVWFTERCSKFLILLKIKHSVIFIIVKVILTYTRISFGFTVELLPDLVTFFKFFLFAEVKKTNLIRHTRHFFYLLLPLRFVSLGTLVE